jgi:hypothetical protein
VLIVAPACTVTIRLSVVVDAKTSTRKGDDAGVNGENVPININNAISTDSIYCG